MMRLTYTWTGREPSAWPSSWPFLLVRLEGPHDDGDRVGAGLGGHQVEQNSASERIVVI